MRMDFGKFKGVEVSAVPHGYLSWALANVKNLDGALKFEIEAELGYRTRSESHQSSRHTALPERARSLAAEVVELGFYAAARKHHPDMGGDHEDMVLLTQVREVLREIVGA